MEIISSIVEKYDLVKRFSKYFKMFPSSLFPHVVSRFFWPFVLTLLTIFAQLEGEVSRLLWPQRAHDYIPNPNQIVTRRSPDTRPYHVLEWSTCKAMVGINPQITVVSKFSSSMEC